jgi:mono/diheme cytochrome c family protein
MRRTVILAVFLMMTTAAGAFAQKDAKAIYGDKCAVCHGPDGAAKTARGRKLKMKSAQEMTSKMSVPDMIKVVTAGMEDMPGFSKELSKEEISAIVDYYRSLGK